MRTKFVGIMVALLMISGQPMAYASEPVGYLNSAYNWKFSRSSSDYLCTKKIDPGAGVSADTTEVPVSVPVGQQPTGVCRYVGELQLTAKANLNGRQVQWFMSTQVTDKGPVKSSLDYNCVDGGAIVNTTCSAGWQANASLTYEKYHDVSSNVYLEDNGTYWFDFGFRWMHSGEPGVWYAPEAGSALTTYFIDCENRTAPCQFSS